MKEWEEQLDSEIESEIEALNSLQYGSTDFKIAVDGLDKLISKSIELKKLEADISEKEQNRELELKKLEVNIEEKSKDRTLEKEKILAELEEKINSRKVDEELRIKQINNEKTDQLIKNAIAVAGIVIPSVITIWGTIKTLKFEQEGTVTTIMGRGFINKLIPKK